MDDDSTQPVLPPAVASPEPAPSSFVQVGGIRLPRTVALAAAGALLLLLCGCVGSGLALGAAGTLIFKGLPLAAFAPTATPAATDSPLAIETPVALATSTQPHVAASTATTQGSTGSSGGGNPWGYNFSCCQLIYAPPSSFCAYYACIGNFWNGSGYVVECSDSLFSLSGGISGACSDHGGVWRPLYAPGPGGHPTVTPTPTATPTPTPTPCVASCGGGNVVITINWSPSTWTAGTVSVMVHTSVPNTGVKLYITTCAGTTVLNMSPAYTDGSGNYTFTFSEPASTRSSALVTAIAQGGKAAGVSASPPCK